VKALHALIKEGCSLVWVIHTSNEFPTDLVFMQPNGPWTDVPMGVAQQ